MISFVKKIRLTKLTMRVGACHGRVIIRLRLPNCILDQLLQRSSFPMVQCEEFYGLLDQYRFESAVAVCWTCGGGNLPDQAQSTGTTMAVH